MIVALTTRQDRAAGGELWRIYRNLLLLVCVLLMAGCEAFLKQDGQQAEQAPEVVEPVQQPEPEPIEPAPEPTPPPAPRPAPRYTLEGRLSLSADSDNILNDDSLNSAVVYFIPAGRTPRVQPRQFAVSTENKLFEPALLVIPVGSEVAFPNNDNILHNVFSVSSGAQFDLGFYAAGESRSYTFTEPGTALINCSVHDSMSADILVLNTPYYARLDNTGEFTLMNLPAGTGRLFIWHPQAREDSHAVKLPVSEPLNLELKLTKPRLPVAED